MRRSGTRCRPLVALAIALALLPATPALAMTGQFVLDQTPNLDAPFTTPVGELDFPFAHRFTLSSGKVVNSPTFTLSTGVCDRVDLALRYATNSNINGNFNELEALARWQLTRPETPWGLALEGAFNTASRSPDAALVGAYPLGPWTLLANLRGFGQGYGTGPTLAAGAGVIYHLTPSLALAGDLNDVVAATNSAAIAAQLPGGLMPAWSLSLQLAIPYSPHTLSLYATNAATRTLEGMSRGDSTVRYGFEFLIPFRSLGRYAALFSPPPAPSSAGAQAPAAQLPTQDVAITGYRFAPERLTIRRGTQVRWTNRDPVAHTVTSDTGAWDSGAIAQGGSFTRRFDQPGDYPYHCLPHPFMRGVIHVE